MRYEMPIMDDEFPCDKVFVHRGDREPVRVYARSVDPDGYHYCYDWESADAPFHWAPVSYFEEG
jgi:hypothetical protein